MAPECTGTVIYTSLAVKNGMKGFEPSRKQRHREHEAAVHMEQQGLYNYNAVASKIELKWRLRFLKRL